MRPAFGSAGVVARLLGVQGEDQSARREALRAVAHARLARLLAEVRPSPCPRRGSPGWCLRWPSGFEPRPGSRRPRRRRRLPRSRPRSLAQASGVMSWPQVSPWASRRRRWLGRGCRTRGALAVATAGLGTGAAAGAAWMGAGAGPAPPRTWKGRGASGAAGLAGAGGTGSAREATVSMVGQGFLCGNETSGAPLSARTVGLFPSALVAGAGAGDRAGAEEGAGAASALADAWSGGGRSRLILLWRRPILRGRRLSVGATMTGTGPLEAHAPARTAAARATAAAAARTSEAPSRLTARPQEACPSPRRSWRGDGRKEPGRCRAEPRRRDYRRERPPFPWAS